MINVSKWIIIKKIGSKYECICGKCNVTVQLVYHGVLNKPNAGCRKCAYTKERLEKIKATNLQRYGTECSLMNKEVQNKIKETNLKLYGVEHPLQNEDIKNKVKQTNLNRFGVESSLQSEYIKNKIKTTNLQKYGVENPTQNQDIKARVKQTNLIRYGTGCSLHNENIKNKTKFTNLIRYGLEYPFFGNEKLYTSLGEKEVKEFIESLGILSTKRRKNNIELDIFIEQKSIAFEYNGIYWHSEKHKPRNLHIDKLKYCQSQGIKLFQILDVEWTKRQTQVKSRIKSLLGVNAIKIPARKCELRKIEDKSIAKGFVNANHIQPIVGINVGKDCWGLYHNGELVSVVIMASHHRTNTELLLKRFCCLDGVTVVGGMSKFAKFLSNYYQKPIYSFADKRWSQGEGYLNSGWEVVNVLPPDYAYVSKSGRELIPKQSRKKDLVNTPDSMTELEHAELDGLARIWDCGKIKLVYRGAF